VPKLSDTPLVDASVPRSGTFSDAAGVLLERGLAAVAVLDEERRVVGLFTNDDLLRGLFPRYLGELRHTAFLEETPSALEARLGQAAAEPVTEHMHAAVTVDVATAPIHVAEKFLHCEWGALAVVEGTRFLGMLDQLTFCRAVMAGRADAH
jgi:CBS domain-containing protein